MQNSKSRNWTARPQRRTASTTLTAASESNTKLASTTDTANSTASNDDNACVVCFRNTEIYAIGDCDHPVCYECATRMRVLCKQNECPICRHVLSKVLFTREKLPYLELDATSRFYSKKYRIGFCTADIQQKFYQLLDHPCSKCDVPPYRNFEDLRNHVQREHNVYFCDLCVDNLKIFTFERRCYTKSELEIHRVKGDKEDTSHRGHPLCEHCNRRYPDRDELFRHLRRDHYFCHFCDADGRNDCYNVYEDLAKHFREEHFLCEEGDCANEQFTWAFRNEIEYKAHVASVHGKMLTKQQAKQTRTLQLEITLGPRDRREQMQQRLANMRSRNDNRLEYVEELPSSSTQRQQPVTIDAGNEEEFPTLAGTGTGPNVSLIRAPPPSMRVLGSSSGLKKTKENFPALGGSGGASVATSNSNVAAAKKPIKTAAAALAASGSAGKVTRAQAPANGMLLHVSNRPTAGASKKPAGEMDFPALNAGKGKKNFRNLEEDMVPSPSTTSRDNVAAKHRTLVDDYVSVAHPSTHQKLQMVQREELEAKARQEAMKKTAPKLTVDDFPSLGPASTKVAVAPPVAKAASGKLNWTKPSTDKKQRELENRKAKVAPAPVLTTTKSTTNNQEKQQKDKKDTKLAEKQNKQEKQQKPNKQKEKNNINNNNNNQKNNNNNNNNEQQLSTNIDISNENLHPGAPPGLKPPPGFMSNVTVNSVAKLPNNLTFTTSLGENYSIVPSPYSYTDPPDTAARNQNLVDQLTEILKLPDAFNEFRVLSSKFRDGSCSGQTYYDHCKSAMQHKFHSLFPELLVMLPDISKQQELYLVHKQYLNTLSNYEAKSLPSLEVCSTCKQILQASDLDSHQQVHKLTKNFPKLATNNGLNNKCKQEQ
ncbi:CG11414 [Drosophila busckii]|uniref:RING-type E3 ubiquitin transferase n=1 Tax=Drosophila busckii TaxID=30019 RepID=A0A0M5J4H7_DROBS|nr:E3 ubiquitin-protein ligase ZNF598 [Drosophila busckii]ALC40756.1 CG11414 [Drosophila busckii]